MVKVSDPESLIRKGIMHCSERENTAYATSTVKDKPLKKSACKHYKGVLKPRKEVQQSWYPDFFNIEGQTLCVKRKVLCCGGLYCLIDEY